MRDIFGHDEWNTLVHHVLCVRRWAIKAELDALGRREIIHALEDAIDARDFDAFARAEARLQLDDTRIRKWEQRLAVAWGASE